METTKANGVTSGAVIWFRRKTAWRKLWSCRSLKWSFWTHFCIGTKQWNRLGYLWIANAKIYDDSVSDVIVLTWVWIILYTKYNTANISLLNDANWCTMGTEYTGQIIRMCRFSSQGLGNNKFVLPRWWRP